jgi:hypothetical protein
MATIELNSSLFGHTMTEPNSYTFLDCDFDGNEFACWMSGMDVPVLDPQHRHYLHPEEYGMEVDGDGELKDLCNAWHQTFSEHLDYAMRLEGLEKAFKLYPPKLDKIYSPREYNFKSDSVDFKIRVNTRKLFKWAKDSEEDFDGFLSEFHKSYDGFMSFMPSSFKEWKTEETDWKKISTALEFAMLTATEEYGLDFHNDFMNNWREEFQIDNFLTEKDFSVKTLEFHDGLLCEVGHTCYASDNYETKTVYDPAPSLQVYWGVCRQSLDVKDYAKAETYQTALSEGRLAKWVETLDNKEEFFNALAEFYKNCEHFT